MAILFYFSSLKASVASNLSSARRTLMLSLAPDQVSFYALIFSSEFFNLSTIEIFATDNAFLEGLSCSL